MCSEHEYHPSRLSLTTVAVIAVIIVAGILGNIYTYQLFSGRATQLENRVAALQAQISALTEALGSYNQTVIGNVSLSELYRSVIDSVVLIRGYVVETALLGETISEVSGSGFVYNFSGQMVVNTNFHVIQNASGLTVTFRNGHSYSADVLGSDPYADLATLSVDAPQKEFQPLPVVSSSLLHVGDLVIAVGNPYGLTGTMTTGVVSQLGRAITDPVTSGYAIAEVIQISTPINPGNSGGPLLNSRGQVVGITTAVVTDSQGIGFAVPSNTILREIAWLVNGDNYPHPWVGVTGMDMSYEIAQAMNTNITSGWLIVGVLPESPAETAGLRGATHNVTIYGQTMPVGGDIILALNSTEIVSGNDVSNYLEEYTFPGQSVILTLERDGHETTVPLKLGTRPQSG